MINYISTKLAMIAVEEAFAQAVRLSLLICCCCYGWRWWLRAFAAVQARVGRSALAFGQEARARVPPLTDAARMISTAAQLIPAVD